MRALLAVLIVLLAVGVGVIHFALIYVLFRGNIFGPFGSPPPGARLPVWPGILPLSQLFVLNLTLYVGLAILFLVLARRGAFLRSLIDVLLIAATVATLVGWNNIRRPNPQGLATWAVGMEIALMVFALVHILTLRPSRA